MDSCYKEPSMIWMIRSTLMLLLLIMDKLVIKLLGNTEHFEARKSANSQFKVRKMQATIYTIYGIGTISIKL